MGRTVFHNEKKLPLTEECVSLRSCEKGEMFRAWCGFFPANDELAEKKT